MIQVPLNPYSDRMPDGSRKHATVSADEGALTLALDVDPREVFTSYRRCKYEEEVEAALIAWPEDIGPDNFVGDAPGTQDARRSAILAEEVRRLREKIGSAVTVVDVHPAPDEARAIAAALIHYAGEVEAGRY